jgi:hypothetical protein
VFTLRYPAIRKSIDQVRVVVAQLRIHMMRAELQM